MIRKYVVYEHVSCDGKRYIGITSQKPNLRWRNGNGYAKNIHFYRSIQKYGWSNFEHNIIAEGVEEEVAKKIERELIKKYNTTNPKYGYNITRGGDTRQPCPEEVKEKIRQKNKGKHRSEETRRKISEAKKGIKRPPMSKEQKEKISKSLIGNKRAMGKHNNTKAVAMCDMCGTILRRFDSVIGAGSYLNCASGSISTACRENASFDGLENTKYGGIYAGYKWFFIDKDGNIINNNVGEKINKRNTPVSQYDLNGKFLRHFETITNAAKSCNFPINGLRFALKNRERVEYRGFLWVKEF